MAKPITDAGNLRSLIGLDTDGCGTGRLGGPSQPPDGTPRNRTRGEDTADLHEREASAFTSDAAPSSSGGVRGPIVDDETLLHDAVNVLNRAGAKFVALRGRDRARAYLQFQTDLMSNLGTLSALIPAKDIVGLSMDIEHYLKGIVGGAGKPPEEMMKEFLNGVEKEQVV